MYTRRFGLLAGVIVCIAVRTAIALAAEPPVKDSTPSKLTSQDEALLGDVLKKYLFDPHHARRVRVPVTVRSVWGPEEKIKAEGWLVPGAAKQPDRIYFADGASIVAPAADVIEKVDFLAACRKRYAPPAKDADEPRDQVFGRMKRNAVGGAEDDDLTLAAWLWRLDEKELAAAALQKARAQTAEAKNDELTAALRHRLEWVSFAALVHAYMVRADDEALAAGEHLIKRYGDDLGDYKQATAIVNELRRRQALGTFGKPPAKQPEGFDKWEATKKIDHLIQALDEVDARQWGQPGGVNLASDSRVQGLIKLGDAAVPALIDVVEKDERLTRSVHFWRDFADSRTVLGVREAALTAIMSILRVQVFQTVSTGDNFTSRGEKAAAQTANQLRAYWKEYGALPFDQRMMAVLTDTKAGFRAKREAAYNLAHLSEDKTFGTMFGTNWLTIGGETKKPNPTIEKFNNPTVAEAIVKCLDLDLAAQKKEANQPDRDDGERLEAMYISALVVLGDRRAAAECARRADHASSLPLRLQWASASRELGEPAALQHLATEFAEGKLPLTKSAPEASGAGYHDRSQLGAFLAAFVEAKLPETDRALLTLSDPKHPYHAAAVQEVLAASSHHWPGETDWFAHPVGLRILIQELKNTAPTGFTVRIESGGLERKSQHESSTSSIPEFLGDSRQRREKATERVCDEAATKLAELVVGLPRYHPLLKDADARLAALSALATRFENKFRALTGPEREALHLDRSDELRFLPDVKRLDHPATADDVAEGRAIFQLKTPGTVADTPLPAFGFLKGEPEERQRVLVVQAEKTSDGKLAYGLIGVTGIRQATADEIEQLRSLGK